MAARDAAIGVSPMTRRAGPGKIGTDRRSGIVDDDIRREKHHAP
jgi:hypothetical protein